MPLPKGTGTVQVDFKAKIDDLMKMLKEANVDISKLESGLKDVENQVGNVNKASTTANKVMVKDYNDIVGRLSEVKNKMMDAQRYARIDLIINMVQAKERLDEINKKLKTAKGDAKIELTIQQANAKKDLAEINQQIKTADLSLKKMEESTKAVEKATEEMGKKSKVTLLDIYAGYNLITGWIGKAIQWTGQFIDASNKQEQAQKKVNFAFGESSKRYDDLAQQIQKLSDVSNENAQELFVVADSMGATSENMEIITKGAIGLSKVFDLQLNSSVKMVTAAIESHDYTMLNRYIPNLKKARNETEKTAILNNVLRKTWDLAKDSTITGAGAIDQFKNKLGDLKEVVGNVIKIVLIPLVKAFSWVVDLIVGPKGQVSSYEQLEIKQRETAESTKDLKDVTHELAQTFEEVTNAIDPANKAITEYEDNLKTAGLSSSAFRFYSLNALRPIEKQYNDLVAVSEKLGKTEDIQSFRNEYQALLKSFKQNPSAQELKWMQELVQQMQEAIYPALKSAEANEEWVKSFLGIGKALDMAGITDRLKKVREEYNQGKISTGEYFQEVEKLKKAYDAIMGPEEQWINDLNTLVEQLPVVGTEMVKYQKKVNDLAEEFKNGKMTAGEFIKSIEKLKEELQKSADAFKLKITVEKPELTEGDLSEADPEIVKAKKRQKELYDMEKKWLEESKNLGLIKEGEYKQRLTEIQKQYGFERNEENEELARSNFVLETSYNLYKEQILEKQRADGLISEKDYLEQKKQLNKEFYVSIIQDTSFFTSSIGQIFTNLNDIDITNAENKKNAKLQALEEEYATGAMLTEEYEKKKAKIQLDADKAVRKAKEKNRDIQVAQAIVDGVASVQKTYANMGGWPLGIIPAGIMAAIAATNIAKMKAQKFSLGGLSEGPSHEDGGIPAVVLGSSGVKPVEIEGKEIIQTKGVYYDPTTRDLANFTNTKKGGREIPNSRKIKSVAMYYADGEVRNVTGKSGRSVPLSSMFELGGLADGSSPSMSFASGKGISIADLDYIASRLSINVIGGFDVDMKKLTNKISVIQGQMKREGYDLEKLS